MRRPPRKEKANFRVLKRQCKLVVLQMGLFRLSAARSPLASSVFATTIRAHTARRERNEPAHHEVALGEVAIGNKRASQPGALRHGPRPCHHGKLVPFHVRDGHVGAQARGGNVRKRLGRFRLVAFVRAGIFAFVSVDAPV